MCVIFFYMQGTSFSQLLLMIFANISYDFSSLRYLRPLSYFLGIVVTGHAGGLFLSKKKYVENFIEHDGVSSCKSHPTTITTQLKLNTKFSTPY